MSHTYLCVLAPCFSDGISQVAITVRLNVGHDTSIAKHCIAGSSDYSCKGLLGDLRPSKAEELVDWHAQSTELARIRRQFLELRIVALCLQDIDIAAQKTLGALDCLDCLNKLGLHVVIT